MLAWKEHEHIDFDFCDCQLQDAIRSEDESYIKSRCRARIGMAGTYLMLIGEDTRSKHKYVRWEAEVALEQGCRIIGVNLDGWRRFNAARTPSVIWDRGAVFVPFSPQIVAHALQNYEKHESGNRYYLDKVYTRLGYRFDGLKAVRPPKPNPFADSIQRRQ